MALEKISCTLFDKSDSPYVRFLTYEGHRGLDVAGFPYECNSNSTAPAGHLVYAPVDSVITRAYNSILDDTTQNKTNNWGNAIWGTITAPGDLQGMRYVLGHLASFSADILRNRGASHNEHKSMNYRVKRGTLLGVEGDTGNTSGNHVHVEVHDTGGGLRVDLVPDLIGGRVPPLPYTQPHRYSDNYENIYSAGGKIVVPPPPVDPPPIKPPPVDPLQGAYDQAQNILNDAIHQHSEALARLGRLERETHAKLQDANAQTQASRRQAHETVATWHSRLVPLAQHFDTKTQQIRRTLYYGIDQ